MFLMQATSSTSGELISWVTAAPDFTGAQFPGPGSPLHIAAQQFRGTDGADGASGEGTLREVHLAEEVDEGDWVCSANDPLDELAVVKATSDNLRAAGGNVSGVMTEAGTPGQTKIMAGKGALLPASLFSDLAPAVEGTKIALNTATARAIRAPYEIPSQTILGTADAEANVLVDQVPPGVRTLRDNLTVVSLLDYGADPTAAESCIAAFDLAIADARTLGAKLLVPAGEYLWDAARTIDVVTEWVGKFTKGGSGTIAISQPIIAPPQQLWNGFSATDITITGAATARVLPEWHGATADAQVKTSGLSITRGLKALVASTAIFTAAMAAANMPIVLYRNFSEVAYSETNQDSLVALDNTRSAVAQSFTDVGAGQLQEVLWYLKKNGTPTSTAVVKVYAADGSGLPTGSVLATSETVDAVALPTSLALVSFLFPNSSLILTENTTYVAVLEYSAGTSTNRIDVGVDGSSPGASGGFATYNGSWTTDATKDACHRVKKGIFGFATTITGYTSPTQVTVADAAPSTFSNAAGAYGTTSSDRDAMRAAKLACGTNALGEVLNFVLQPRKNYACGSSGFLFSGGAFHIEGNYAKLLCLDDNAGGVLTTDDGTAGNDNKFSCTISRLKIDGCGVATYGVLLGKETNPTAFGGIGGVGTLVDRVYVERVKSHAFNLRACQLASFRGLSCAFVGGDGVRAIGCNAAGFYKCDLTWCGGNGFTIDSLAAFGAGSVDLSSCAAEVTIGHGVALFDTSGAATPAVVRELYTEGVRGDSVYVDRPRSVIQNCTFGGGSQSYQAYPVRLTSKGKGCVVTHNYAGGYVGSGHTTIRAEAGAQFNVLEPNFSVTLSSPIGVSNASGWDAPIQQRFATGDQHMRGKLGIGTHNPIVAFEIADGSMRQARGSAMLGAIRNPYGGIGRGQNLLLRSEEISHAAWTKVSVTVVADQAYSPDLKGTNADRIVAAAGATSFRQEADLNALLGYTSVGNGGTKAYVFSMVMQAAGIDASLATLTADASGGSSTVLVDAGGQFITDGVEAGDQIRNVTEGVTAFVISVDSETQLTTTAVGNWNGDSYVHPYRLRLQISPGNNSPIATSNNLVVNWFPQVHWIGGTTTSAASAMLRCNVSGSSNSNPWRIYAWGASAEEIPDVNAPLVPGPYLKTVATARVTPNYGPAFNDAPCLPGGTFTMTAATATKVVTDTRITATTIVEITPADAAARTLDGADAVVQKYESNSAGASFTATTLSGAGTSVAGGETYRYVLKETWAN